MLEQAEFLIDDLEKLTALVYRSPEIMNMPD